ncbi:hypothetical protein GRI69_04450 [Erythrobacter vulgaris]|uniref:Tetratricopeptide repeat protein n=1 Tax=Qipengyuania vulgaris TaxID=291985 RepID=A0A844XPU6_9SPHN|nr:hypothetical protein [Qipengyuania vulgaris]MXO47506.1 hypothetical protein [Qipengyuania vulgaris]
MISRLFLAGLAIALAPIVAIHAHASSAASASDWAVRLNGFQLAEQALSAIRTSEEGGQAAIQADKDTLEKARVAFSKEPFASDALFVLSLDRGAQQHAVLSAARQLDKRNRLTGLALLQAEVAQNNLERVLPLVDQLSRVEPDLAPQFVSVLSESWSDAGSLSLLEQALRDEPSWATAFWRRIPRDEASLERYAALRERLSPPSDPQTERNLLSAFVETGRFPEAFELYEQARSATDNPDEFYPPIDWRVSETRDVRARLISTDTMDVFVKSNASGEFARKLVALSPGDYRISSEISVKQGNGTLQAKLACASSDTGSNWFATELSGDARVTVPQNTCPYAWLILEASAWESSLDLEAIIEGVELTSI